MDVYGVFTFFQTACSLLYLNAAELEEALIMRITVAGSTSIKGRWRQQQSEVLKESLRYKTESVSDVAKKRMRETIERMVNEGDRGMVTFIL